MMKLKSIALVAATLFLTACGGGGNDGTATNPGTGSNAGSAPSGSSQPQLRIFNAKGENAIEFQALAEAYYDETGIQVNVFSVGSGQDHATPLRAEITSANPPHIFSVQGIKELADWVDGNFILDLATIDNHPEFQALVNDIPQELRLTTDGTNSFGIPYNVEGYGYIVDTQMLYDLFENADIDELIEDIRLATYAEWQALVLAIDAYIQDASAASAASAATVTLNGSQYSFRPQITGLAQNLTGVFAVMGAESWTYGDHFSNVALNAAFASASEAYQATAADLDAIHDIFLLYARALDFKTSHMAGLNGPARRGFDFVSPANFGYDQTINIFAQSRAVFLKQGNWAEGNIRNTNPEVAERLVFLPVKMPVTQDMIRVDGMTVEKFNSSIPVFVPMHYAINNTVSEEEQLMAMDFLIWLNTSETGQRFIVEEFLFIPYNLDMEIYSSIGFPLGDSIISYINKNAVLSAPWQGSPGPWGSDIFGTGIMENHMIREVWTEENHNEIANFAISSWQQLLGQ